MRQGGQRAEVAGGGEAHLELSGESELELAIDALVLGVRVQSILERDVDGAVEVQSVNLGGVTGEGRREEQLLAL
jgi:hypothetical protein